MSFENDLLFEKACKEDLCAVVSLYRLASAQEGCTWNEYYPTLADAEHDFESETLFVLRCGGVIIGAASVVSENELDGLECWEEKNGSCHEIARVVIASEFEGRGYAKHMLEKLIKLLSDEGCSAIHLLVAKNNDAAMGLYRSLGFAFLCECEMYGNVYYACEKNIK